MKISDIRKKGKDELIKMLSELKAEVREFRFGMSGGRTKNVKKSKELRKDIARVFTALRDSKTK